MSSYLGRYAAHYDVIYQDKPYAAEAQFVEQVACEQLGKRPKTWLDVACGTGNHAVYWAKRGYDVTGVDYSVDQLAEARRKVQAVPGLNFREADMRTLDAVDGPFDVISCLFDSIGYAKTNAGVLSTLRAMRQRLTSSGVIILEFWHAAAMLRSYEPLRVRRWALPNGELLRVSESRLNVVEQTCIVKYSLYVHDALEHYETLTETQENRYFLLQEMSALLEAAGLRLQRAFAGYDASATIDENTFHILVTATAEA